MSYYTGHGGTYFSESPEGDAQAREWKLTPTNAPENESQARFTDAAPGLCRVDFVPPVKV